MTRFSSKKMYAKMWSAKCWPLCLGMNMLTKIHNAMPKAFSNIPVSWLHRRCYRFYKTTRPCMKKPEAECVLVTNWMKSLVWYRHRRKFHLLWRLFRFTRDAVVARAFWSPTPILGIHDVLNIHTRRLPTNDNGGEGEAWCGAILLLSWGLLITSGPFY